MSRADHAAADFAGKVALVTGAAAGIGRGAALGYAERGAKVVVADLSETGQQVAREICEQGGEAIFVRCDVASEAEVDLLFDTALSEFRRIDVAFNNAGIDIEKADEWGRIDVFDKTWNINGRGIFLCMRREIRQMLAQGGGSIVNASSIAGVTGAGPFAYSAAKHAVVGMTRSAAMTYGKQGIRINAVCPAAIDTAMIHAAMERPGAREKIAQMHPIGRMGTIRDVVDALLWLSSDASAFVTGHALPIDGGYCAA